jgi:hypothetical protein
MNSESKPLSASESMYDFGAISSTPQVAEVKAVVHALSPKVGEKSSSSQHGVEEEDKNSVTNESTPVSVELSCVDM